jgi:hypothetical protein
MAIIEEFGAKMEKHLPFIREKDREACLGIQKIIWPKGRPPEGGSFNPDIVPGPEFFEDV